MAVESNLWHMCRDSGNHCLILGNPRFVKSIEKLHEQEMRKAYGGKNGTSCFLAADIVFHNGLRIRYIAYHIHFTHAKAKQCFKPKATKTNVLHKKKQSL